MTGRELIAALLALDPDTRNLPIIIRGYEGGHDDVSQLELVEIATDRHAGESYYGRHEIVHDAEEKEWVTEDKPGTQFSKAIHLIGYNH